MSGSKRLELGPDDGVAMVEGVVSKDETDAGNESSPDDTVPDAGSAPPQIG